MTNPLIDDLGITSSPPKQTNPLFGDLGISRGGTDLSTAPDEDTSSAHPVTDELWNTTKDVVKAIPRQLATGGARVLDQLSSGTLGGGIPAMTPEAQQVEDTRQKDLTQHPVVQAAATEIADRLGLPRTNTKNPLASVIGSGVESLPSGALFGPEAILPTAASSMASETAKQAGAGPGGQFLAGLTPLAPTAGAATIRGLTRGADGAAMEANLNAAKNSGINISAGQASGNPVLQGVEAVSSKLPGGGPLKATRGTGLNDQIESSVSDMVGKLDPNLNQNAPTPTTAGEQVQGAVKSRIAKLNNETTEARQGMEDAIGKDTPFAAPKFEATLQKVTNSTGVPEIDSLVTGAKTKAINKAVGSITEDNPSNPNSNITHSVDNGFHKVESPNGFTTAQENGKNLQITDTQTSLEGAGQGEGTGRVQKLIDYANNNGLNFVSDARVSQDAAGVYTKLASKGYKVTKNPNVTLDGNDLVSTDGQPIFKVQGSGKSAASEAPNVSKTPISYSTDGEGSHIVSSPSGATTAIETASGDMKVMEHDSKEGVPRLETLAHVATSKGGNLISDVSVTPSEALDYEKLGRKGWTVEKNPNAEKSSTGNILSDSPKNPVYTVKAPATKGSGNPVGNTSAEKQFTGEWTYNPQTGKSEPVTAQGPNAVGPRQEGQNAILNQPTPHTFDSLRTLRTNIRQSIDSTTNPFQKGQLKQLYGAISDDLQDGAAAKGPEAEAAYGLFNSVAKQNAATQKTLTRAVKTLGGPEQVFKAAMNGTKDGASKVAPIMQSLDSDGQNLFRATVLHRMGRAGGAADAPFDANTFINNWKGMSPEAKNVLFGEGADAGPRTQLRSSLDSLSQTMDRLKSQGYITSNLTKAVAQGHGNGNIIQILAYGWLGEHGVAAASHLASGSPIAAAGAVGAGVGALAANPVLSRILTNPKTTMWLAQATKSPASAVPILMNQLDQMGDKDQDAKSLSDLIKQSAPSLAANGGSSPAPAPTPKSTPGQTIYPKINRSAGMQPLPGGGYGIPPESF